MALDLSKYEKYGLEVKTSEGSPKESQKRANTLLDNPVTRTLQNLPGKELGTQLGSSLFAIKEAVKTRSFQPINEYAAEFDKNAKKLIGDTAQAVAAPASIAFGAGPTALGRLGTNVALGSVQGAGAAAANDASLKEIVKGAGTGAAFSGALSGFSEGVGAMANNLPRWFTKAALPKLDKANTQYALANTKLGSTKTLLANSDEALNSYESSIQGILNHPEYRQTIGSQNSILNNAVRRFPNSEYTVNDLMKNARKIAPEVRGLLTKFEQGNANVQEVNSIRKALDKATKSVYTSTNRPPEAKSLGAALSNAMREFVKDTAPETRSLFDNYSKEINLNTALQSVVQRKESQPTLKDLAAAYAGFEIGGVRGAVSAVVAQRLGGSSGTQLAVGKGFNALAKTAPTAGALTRGIRGPAISEIVQSGIPQEMPGQESYTNSTIFSPEVQRLLAK